MKASCPARRAAACFSLAGATWQELRAEPGRQDGDGGGRTSGLAQGWPAGKEWRGCSQPLFSASCAALVNLAHQRPFLGLPAPSSPLSACPGWGEKGAGGGSPRMLRHQEGPRASWSCRGVSNIPGVTPHTVGRGKQIPEQDQAGGAAVVCPQPPAAASLPGSPPGQTHQDVGSWAMRRHYLIL